MDLQYRSNIAFSTWIAGYRFTHAITAHFSPHSSSSEFYREECVRRTKRWIIDTNIKVLRRQLCGATRFKTATFFETKCKSGLPTSFHIHSLWMVPEEWEDRFQRVSRNEWCRITGQRSPNYYIERINAMSLALAIYDSKQQHSGYQPLLNLE